MNQNGFLNRITASVLIDGQQINGITADKYTSDNVLDIYNNELSIDEKIALEKLIGQQQPKEAKYYNEDVEIQHSITIYDGPQTYKKNQPALTLVIPLWFFFCRNPSMRIFTPHNRKTCWECI